ncbi:MAG: ExbD/TolR family protein [Methylococcales bacterium]
MAIKSQSNDQEAMSEINVTPLVDVMLVLVIILLVTAPLLTQSVQVNLPKTAQTTPNVDPRTLQLGIDQNGIITLNKQVVANTAALEVALKTEVSRNPDMVVHLFADQSVNYGKVAEVMAAVQHAGIIKMGFVTIEQ